MNDYPFGKIGCIISGTAYPPIKAATLWVFALISMERRAAVQGVGCLKKQFASPKCLAVTAAVLGLVFVAWYAIHLEANGSYTIFSVLVAGVKKGRKRVQVCTSVESKLTSERAIWSVIYLLATVVVPLTMISINASVLFWHVRKSPPSAMPPVFAAQKGREIRLSILMLFSFLIFVTGIIPRLLALYFIAEDSDHKLLSTGFFYGTVISVLESTMNPLWTVFLVKKKQREPTKTTSFTRLNSADSMILLASLSHNRNRTESNASALIPSVAEKITN